jgi:PKD repeat protein
MPNLGGFEVVGELTVGVLNQVLGSAWDNDLIPHSVDIPAGTAFGPYQLADGVVNIRREGVSLTMDPPVNGVAITLASEVQVEIAHPPVPSARIFDMTASIGVRVPIGVLPGTTDVAALLSSIPLANVSATLTSGDPVPPITLDLIAEYIHARYTDGTIPATQTQSNVSLFPFTADVFLEIFDDASNPSRRIEVDQPTATTVRARLPVHLRLSNISAASGPQPLSPMGIEGRIAITFALVTAPGSLTARFSTASVGVEGVNPAPGTEGANYSVNRAGANALGIDLEAILRNQIISRGQAIVAALGDQTFSVPTVADIEAFIAAQAHTALIGRGDINLWTPTPPAEGGVTISDVKPLALSDALAFCLNNPAGDTSVIVNFIPAGRSCAIAIDGARVIKIINDRINKPESEGGFGGIPHSFSNIDGHDARLTRLDASLRVGSIHLEGDVTVIDAIAGSIDADASFEAEVGLRWVDNPSGGQMIEPFTISQDVDLSVLAWILSFLLGFITLGLVGGIIALVVVAVAEGVAERIGGAIIRDEVTGQVKGVGAWPQTLNGIGQVNADFENPILIDPQSVMFPDAYQVTATFASTVIAFADTRGPYLVDAGSQITFNGGPAAPNTSYQWEFGDGGTDNAMVATHVYADNGTYVAKLSTLVSTPGGVTTREFARVLAANVPPTVLAGPDIVIDEGDEFDFVVTFTDPEWLDTHRAVFDFGDDSLPVEVAAVETNDPPAAKGTAHAKHAYCDNGVYTVTTSVRDDDGGVGVATQRVTVLNVAPTVDAGPDMFAYFCAPITLEACFVDPGWCDTHTATWDFGDCTPVHPAVVRGTHESPAAIGVAAATHVYDRCGNYLARCVVIDDDGGVGEDTIIVRVVDVANKGFEGGFRYRLAGPVANEWDPYLVGAPRRGLDVSAPPSMNVFAAEEFIVHGGQRSQRIAGFGSGRAGIRQRVGANRGWDYQVSTWYSLDDPRASTCRLGVDPTGGGDPDAAAVVWSEGNAHTQWEQLVVRVTATNRAVAIFLELSSDSRTAHSYFDDVVLLPYPCPLKDCARKPLPPDRPLCVDWKAEREPARLGPEYKIKGFAFRSLSQMPLQIATWGQPPNQGKLQFPGRGVSIVLPYLCDRVVAEVGGSLQDVELRAFDANSQEIGAATTIAGSGPVQTLEVISQDIAGIVLSGGSNEGLLISLCIERAKNGDSNEQPPRTLDVTGWG